jgi:hypothetical protein
MSRDDGSKFALGAMAALAGLAALGARQKARGGRNAGPKTLHFSVKIPRTYKADATANYVNTVSIEWDGRPETYPTREAVLAELMLWENAEDMDSLVETMEEDGKQSVFNWIQDDPDEHIDVEVSPQTDWTITPQNLKIRTALGGRRVSLVDDQAFGTLPDWMKS